MRPRPVVAHEDGDRVAQSRPSVLETIGNMVFGEARASQAVGGALTNVIVGALDAAFQDRMGAPGALRRDHDYVVAAERGEGNVVFFPFERFEEAMDCLSVGARTRRFLVEINRFSGTWSESHHSGNCPAADDRIRARLREELEALKQ